MAPKLYMMPLSYPSRSVLLTAEAMGLELDVQIMDLMAGEHLKPEFLKMNPRHQIPVLDDDGFVLCESVAIMSYLVDKYAKDDSLYPKDVDARAIVNERLMFFATNFFPKASTISKGVFMKNWSEVPQDVLDDLQEAYGFIEDFLQKNTYIAGDSPTIADFAILATMTSMEVFIPVNEEEYPKTKAWLENLKSQPYYQVNIEGSDQYQTFVKAKLASA